MNIQLLGDLAFTGILCTEANKNTVRFSQVLPLLPYTDLIFANLEIPINSSTARNEYKNFTLSSSAETTIDLLRNLNISCVSLANNHIYDCKMPGLKATISVLDDLGIFHTGAGWEPQHIEPILIEQENLKIGFIAYVDKSTNPKTENFPELLINYFNLEQVIKDVSKLRPQVDKIICSIHWGVDYSSYPTPKQINYAKKLIDSGVDIIMGHHPHTLQPFEIYKSGIIFYSLAGLTFGDYVQNGSIISLPRKTKKSVITVMDSDFSKVNFYGIKELKGNYLKRTTFNYEKWNRKRWKIYDLKKRYKLVNDLVNFKESFFDRTIEYFFGYYNNPIKRIFQFKNLGKIKKLFLSYKQLQNS